MKDRSTGDTQLVKTLRELRQARCRDVRDAKGFLVRRQLTEEDVATWERLIPAPNLWLPARQRDDYMPGSCISGVRHEWPRIPFLPKYCGCYLCGREFDSHQELRCNRKEDHVALASERKDVLEEVRVEEEIRKRLFFLFATSASKALTRYVARNTAGS